MEESTTLCSNCQRQIAASNYVIHSLHCQRNLTKCEKCGEAVPRSAMDEHDSEFHAKVNCPDCEMLVERSQLETHQKTYCRLRQQRCPYCELELPANEFHEHEIYCGSRTKKCEECGEYVMLKYEQLHIDSNHGFLKLDDEPGPTATWIKNDLESGSSRPAKSNNNKKPQLNTGKFESVDEDIPNLFANLMKEKKVIGTNPLYPGVAYPISGGPQRTVSKSPPLYQENMEDSTDLVALPCEFCEAMIPVNQLILHQTACRMDLTSFGRAKKSQNEISKNKFSCIMVDDSDDDAEEIKGSRTKADLARRHRVGDDIGLASLALRRNAFSNPDGGIQDEGQMHEGSEAALRQDFDDDGVYLPCEFCGDGYPPSLLLEHQDVCPKSSTASSLQSVDQIKILDGLQVVRSFESQKPSRARKFDESDHNTFVDSDQYRSNGARGKSNISNSYNDLHGNFTVASEWSDDSDSRPTSATGAIPKQKAGKLNVTRKVNQEAQGSRPTNSMMANQSRVNDKGPVNSHSDHSPRFRIRNNLKDRNGGGDDDLDDE